MSRYILKAMYLEGTNGVLINPPLRWVSPTYCTCVGRWAKTADPPQAPPHPDHQTGCSLSARHRRLLPPPPRAQHALGCKAQAGRRPGAAVVDVR